MKLIGSCAFWLALFLVTSSSTALARRGTVIDPSRVPIYHTKPSQWPYSRWSNFHQFSRYSGYEYTAEGVRFRGIEFKPGDVILSKLNSDSDGVYISFFENLGKFSHAAVFTILKKNGTQFPAVIEIHELGVRAVPLARFMHPDFTSYVEVFRAKDIPHFRLIEINARVLDAISTSHGYDFYADFSESDYLSCTELVLLVLGLNPEELDLRPSFLDLSGFDNFAALDMSALFTKPILTPDNFAASENFVLQGSIDNQRGLEQLARDLVRLQFRKFFWEQRLSIDNLPILYDINHFGVGSIKAQTFMIGRISLWFSGFTADTFPNGPAKLLASVEIFEREIARAARRLINDSSFMEMLSQQSTRSVEELFKLPEVQSYVDAETTKLRAFFE